MENQNKAREEKPTTESETGTESEAASSKEHNRQGSVVKRRGSSLGGDADLVDKMSQRWSKTSLDVSELSENDKKEDSGGEEDGGEDGKGHHRKQTTVEAMQDMHARRDAYEKAFEENFNGEEELT